MPGHQEGGFQSWKNARPLGNFKFIYEGGINPAKGPCRVSGHGVSQTSGTLANIKRTLHVLCYGQIHRKLSIWKSGRKSEIRDKTGVSFLSQFLLILISELDKFWMDSNILGILGLFVCRWNFSKSWTSMRVFLSFTQNHHNQSMYLIGL